MLRLGLVLTVNHIHVEFPFLCEKYKFEVDAEVRQKPKGSECGLPTCLRKSGPN